MLQKNVFKHPCGHERLPVEIARRVAHWKRPSEVFGDEGLMVKSMEDKNDIDHVLTVNEPLMNVKVIPNRVIGSLDHSQTTRINFF